MTAGGAAAGIAGTALVVSGSRNRFTVRIDGRTCECGIKGKVLRDIPGFYNVLAPGDLVTLENGQIVSALERRNCFARLNQKEDKPQALAANIDRVLCLASPASPPFRPRFLDRLLVQAEVSGVEPLIVCNKCDLGGFDPDVEERFKDYERIGYPVLKVSALTGTGIDALRRALAGKTSLLAGQSGVGKSSLVNVLAPGAGLKTGELNKKYGRGNHTTSLSALFDLPEPCSYLIDTPGVRRMAVWGLCARDLPLYMKEFAPLAGTCSYGLSCSHTNEPGCRIMEAVAAGVIHEDRYESFLRMFNDLA